MYRQIANIGFSPNLNYRQKRVLQMINLSSTLLAVLILIPVTFNFYFGETVNGFVLLGISLVYWSVLLWNKYGYFNLAKIISGYSLTLIPFINLAIAGRIPEGQYLSMIPACFTSFCCLLIITDQRTERLLYIISYVYFILFALFFDKLIAYWSSDPIPEFIQLNYTYYKIPFIICMICIVLIFQLFNSIFYMYEKEVEASNQAILQKNNELKTLNLSLESKVIERTCDLQESNNKIIDLAFITAHEIRGPLSSILSVTQFIKNNPGDHSIYNVLPDLHDRSITMDSVIKKMVIKLEGEIIAQEKAGINKTKR